MAKIKKPPVPTKMYRHFAVVTVLLTASLAVFADGENEEYYAQQTAAQQPQQSTESETPPERKDIGAPAYGEAQLTRRDGAASGGFSNGPEFDSSYGRASGPGGSRFSSQLVPADNSENAGFTAAHLDKLSEQELTRLLEALREDGIESESERRNAVAVMEAASRRRSGHRTSVG